MADHPPPYSAKDLILLSFFRPPLSFIVSSEEEENNYIYTLSRINNTQASLSIPVNRETEKYNDVEWVGEWWILYLTYTASPMGGQKSIDFSEEEKILKFLK